MNPTLSSADAETDALRGKYIPWMIVAFFAAFILLLSSFVWIAFAHQPDEVTSNPYEKGLAYNRTLEQAEAQAALGWKMDVAVADGTLRVTLADAESQPLPDATVSMWLLRPSSKAMDRQVTLAETAGGIYEAVITPLAKGRWDVHVTVEKNGQQFQTAKRYMAK